IELAGVLDGSERVPGGDGDAVVCVGADVLDVVAVALEHPAGVVGDGGRLGLLEAHDVGARALEEPLDTRRPGAQRVEVPGGEALPSAATIENGMGCIIGPYRATAAGSPPPAVSGGLDAASRSNGAGTSGGEQGLGRCAAMRAVLHASLVVSLDDVR